MKKILLYVASLRHASYNRQLAAMARRALEGKARVEYATWEQIPLFNQDAEWPTPESVLRLRQQFQQADGVWFFTPEYNGSIPGSFKNVLDWLSRPVKQGDNWKNTVLAGKKATLSSVAGNSGGKYAVAELEKLLTFCMMDVMEEDVIQIALSAASFTDELLEKTPGIEASVTKQADAFVNFLNS